MTITVYKDDLPDDLLFFGAIAVDTETLGLKPHRDRLCVVQISGGDGHAHLVQISVGQTKAPNLKKIFEDSNIIKIFHFARFDVAVLKKNLDINLNPIYCTKIASKLVRTYTDRHGLKDLCAELININLSKQQQSSNWAAGELSNAQLEYAASDVYYLHQLKEKLDAMLQMTGRTDLAQSCFDFLKIRAELDLKGWDDTDIFSHSS